MKSGQILSEFGKFGRPKCKFGRPFWWVGWGGILSREKGFSPGKRDSLPEKGILSREESLPGKSATGCRWPSGRASGLPPRRSQVRFPHPTPKKCPKKCPENVRKTFSFMKMVAVRAFEISPAPYGTVFRVESNRDDGFAPAATWGQFMGDSICF